MEASQACKRVLGLLGCWNLGLEVVQLQAQAHSPGNAGDEPRPITIPLPFTRDSMSEIQTELEERREKRAPATPLWVEGGLLHSGDCHFCG